MRTKDPDKQRRIKQAMVRLILREGINGASVSKIARDAGVSPATIYIYYSNKEEMLSEVFHECSRHSFSYLMGRLRPDMDAGELIEALVRGCFEYTVEHEEMFSFVEQCSRCPTVSEAVSYQECCCDVFDVIHDYQRRGQLRQCSDQNMSAVLFAPVRFIAMNRNVCGEGGQAMEAQLRELIGMLQGMLLRQR